MPGVLVEALNPHKKLTIQQAEAKFVNKPRIWRARPPLIPEVFAQSNSSNPTKLLSIPPTQPHPEVHAHPARNRSILSLCAD